MFGLGIKDGVVEKKAPDIKGKSNGNIKRWKKNR